jgi:kynureninase
VTVEVPDRAACAALDAADPLAHCRDRFVLPRGLVYLDGNSLGALPRAVRAAVDSVIDHEWGHDLIASWDDNGWWDAPVVVGDVLAPLLGAGPGQVVVCDSTSVNVAKQVEVALTMRPGRDTIVTEIGNFPTDRYLVDAIAARRGARVVAVPRAEVVEAMGERPAVVVLTHVDYRTGEVHDLRAVTEAAHAAGALTLWDLSHSAGAVPLALDDDGADLAVGCGYKYLNGGPGAPAYVYVAARHQVDLPSPLPGWVGHADPFAMEDAYRPADGVRRLLVGTPPILALAAFGAALSVFHGVAMADLRAKSLALTDLFIDLVEARELPVTLATPRDHHRRGSQVSLRHPAAPEVMDRLIAAGVVGDIRPPDILRFGFAPLYVRYVDVWDAADALATILTTGRP